MAFIDIPPVPPAIVEVQPQESSGAPHRISNTHLPKLAAKPSQNLALIRHFSQVIDREGDIDEIIQHRFSSRPLLNTISNNRLMLDSRDNLPRLAQSEVQDYSDTSSTNTEDSDTFDANNPGDQASDHPASDRPEVEVEPLSTDDDNINGTPLDIPLSEEEQPLILDETGNESRLDITADYQDFDPIRQIVTAEGNVQLRLNDAILQADKLWVNILNRYTLAEGNVLLTRGEQIIRGQRAEYSYILGSGIIFEAQGDIFFPSLEGTYF